MSTQALARPLALSSARPWRWLVLVLLTLVPRLVLLRIYDVELSQDGFEAVRTITILQAQGAGAVPRDLVDRFILHPFYMLLLYAVRIITPAAVDFYIVARLFSAVVSCIAILVLFILVRRAYSEPAAWAAALVLSFAPSFLWESVAILSSTLFLALYLGVLLGLFQARYRLAAFLAFLSALTRYEGMVLIGLVLIALAYRDLRAHSFMWADWAIAIGLALAVPLAIMVSGWLAIGSPTEFLGAQSMASIWLRFMAPGDFLKRGAFFLTQYPALLPWPVVWLGIVGAVLALSRYRNPATWLLLLISVLYVMFFEVLVWFDYTTLEVRFLMYAGLPLIVFTGVVLGWLRSLLNRFPSAANLAFVAAVLILVVMSYYQADAGMRFVYNMMASQREMADELASFIPAHQPTSLMVYTGNAGALDMYGRQHGLELAFTDFRFAPDDNPEQFLLARSIRYVVYPVGNAFAKAKYPYLARFETQTHGPVAFQALTQFATSTDNQLYSIWSVSPAQ